MPYVAFATCQRFPAINDADRLVADVLQEQNVNVVPAVWDAPDIDWSQFDCVVIRSTWDYHLKSDKYENWLGSFSRDSHRLWNPPDVVRENINKRHLTTLAQRGFSVVPTYYQSAGNGFVLSDILQQHDWRDVVIRPAISGCAYGTWRTSLDSAEQDQVKFADQLRCEELLIQPYAPQVETQGEWSLVFFDGQFSHAVLKRPATFACNASTGAVPRLLKRTLRTDGKGNQ